MDAENNVVDANLNKEDQQRHDNDNEAQPVELNDEHPNVDNSNQLNTNHRRLVLDNEGKELDDVSCRFKFSLIYVYAIAKRLECVETDSYRQNEM